MVNKSAIEIKTEKSDNKTEKRSENKTKKDSENKTKN